MRDGHDGTADTASTPQFAQRRLVTVIAEAVLEDRIVHDLRAWGVGGLTIVRAVGDPFGSRVGDVEGGFRRIECLVSDATAERVMAGLAERYLMRFKVVAYDHPVRVVRGGKYV